MNILILNTLYFPFQVGGAEKSVQSLAESFKEMGVNVEVVSLSDEDENTIVNGVPVTYLKIQNVYWPFDGEERSSVQKMQWHRKDIMNKKYDQSIEHIFQRFSPNILFTNNLSGFSVRVWELAKKYKIKIIHVLRDYYLQCPKTTRYKNEKNCEFLCLDCKIFSKQKKRASKNVDVVVGISQAILDAHISKGYFYTSASRVIYNGFELNQNTVTREKNKLRTFGFIGQVKPSKGLELLLRSFLKIEELNDWKLVIAGKVAPEYHKKLQSINDSSKISYIGYTDADTFFNKIDVLIVPSLWKEPFGRVVLEGLIHKKLILASNIGGIREILSNNESFLFDPETDELSEKLRNILLSPEYRESFIFDDEYLNTFQQNNISKQYKQLFIEVLKLNR